MEVPTEKVNGKSRTKELLDQLKERIKGVQSSEEFKKILSTMALFHSYSWHNTLLIWMQRPDATRVAGLRAWNRMGRQVMKGEKGIAIYAPMRVKRKDEPAENEDDIITLFKIVYVFDVGQTTGEPLPNFELNEIANTHEELLQKLQDLCGKYRIEIEFKELARVDGMSRIGSIVINSKKNPTEQAIILIHEIAHERLHSSSEKRHELTTEQKEMEAESVAFIVCQQLGLPETNSDKYLALYQKSYDLQESLAVIHQTAQEILTALSPSEKPATTSEPETAGKRQPAESIAQGGQALP